MKINENLTEILQEGKFEGNIYLLPNIQLDRKDYLEINKILESLGGKWKRGTGHVFEGEQEQLENALLEVLENGETQTLSEIKKKYQFYPTPKEIAEKLVELADLGKNDIVLEPSAGQGAITNVINRDSEDLVLIEYNIDNCKVLAEQGYNPIHMDFLEYQNNGYFTKIIANPPFSKNQDVKHILHMYELLAKGGRIVTIAPCNLLNKTTKLHEELKNTGINKVMDLGEGAFKGAGTMINTSIYIIQK